MALTASQKIRIRTIVISILVGALILGLKFIAAEMTGSAALQSDAIESMVNVAAAIFAFDRLFLYMEKRGWIYYRKKKPSSSALSNACLEVQQLLEPSKKYVVEVKKDEKKQQAEAGDQDDRGTEHDRDETQRVAFLRAIAFGGHHQS